MNSETQNDGYDIAIAGSGYAGAALALALADTFAGGLRIALIDPAPASAQPLGEPRRPDARASALAAASQRLLAALGVWPAVAPHAEPVLRIEITDSGLTAGVRPVLLTYDNIVEGGPGTHIVENDRLLAAVRAAAVAAPGVDAFAGTKVQSARPSMAAMDVALTDGRALTARLLVVAEGRASPLRAAAGIKTVDWHADQTGIVTTVDLELPHHGTAVQHFLPGGPFAILPLPGRRACITWSETALEARRILALDDAAFLGELDRRSAGRFGRVALAGPRQSWPLHMHLARTYAAERLVLIGDAAHAVHPIAGQGLNLGLRDVAALAEVLADAARLGTDLGSAGVLDRYTRWRRTDSALSAVTFETLNRLFSNDSAVLRTARDAGLVLVDRTDWLKQAFVAEAAGLTGTLPRLLRGERL